MILPKTAHFKVIQNNSSPECLKVKVDLSSRCLFFFSPTFFQQRSYSHSDACHREQTLVLPFNRHQPLPPPFTFPSDTHTLSISWQPLSTSRRKYLDFNFPAAILAFCHFQDETILQVLRLEGCTCGVKTNRNHTMNVTKPSVTVLKKKKKKYLNLNAFYIMYCVILLNNDSKGNVMCWIVGLRFGSV